MKLIYDDEADAVLIVFGETISPGGAIRSHMCDLEIREGAVILLFDDDEKLMGFEILGASRLLSELILSSAETTDSK